MDGVNGMVGVRSIDLDAILATDGALRLLVNPPGGEDMRRFTALTHGRRCIVGRRTAEGLLLPHRTLVPAARDLAGQPGDMIVGGAAIYTAYWPRIRRIFLSRFHAPLVPETVGEPIDLGDFARLTVMTAVDHTFEIWQRKSA